MLKKKVNSEDKLDEGKKVVLSEVTMEEAKRFEKHKQTKTYQKEMERMLKKSKNRHYKTNPQPTNPQPKKDEIKTPSWMFNEGYNDPETWRTSSIRSRSSYLKELSEMSPDKLVILQGRMKPHLSAAYARYIKKINPQPVTD